MPPDEAGEALWRFALALYARPGVAAALLALQDRGGQNVTLILFALWLGAVIGKRLDPGGVAAARGAAAPLDAVVRELRRLRRALKPDPAPDSQRLRRSIAAIELAAERRVLARLAAEAGAMPDEAEADRLALAAGNLALCLGPASGSEDAGRLRAAVAALLRRA